MAVKSQLTEESWPGELVEGHGEADGSDRIFAQ
jgi:hypothetical protein